MSQKVIGTTDEGRRAGQWHPKAVLTDEQVDLVREWHDTGLVGYRAMVGLVFAAFGVRTNRDTLRDIIRCDRRYALVVRSKRVGGITDDTRD